jgi:hypothetical protein
MPLDRCVGAVDVHLQALTDAARIGFVREERGVAVLALDAKVLLEPDANAAARWCLERLLEALELTALDRSTEDALEDGVRVECLAARLRLDLRQPGDEVELRAVVPASVVLRAARRRAIAVDELDEEGALPDACPVRLLALQPMLAHLRHDLHLVVVLERREVGGERAERVSWADHLLVREPEREDLGVDIGIGISIGLGLGLGLGMGACA